MVTLITKTFVLKSVVSCFVFPLLIIFNMIKVQISLKLVQVI